MEASVQSEALSATLISSSSSLSSTSLSSFTSALSQSSDISAAPAKRRHYDRDGPQRRHRDQHHHHRRHGGNRGHGGDASVDADDGMSRLTAEVKEARRRMEQIEKLSHPGVNEGIAKLRRQLSDDDTAALHMYAGDAQLNELLGRPVEVLSLHELVTLRFSTLSRRYHRFELENEGLRRERDRLERERQQRRVREEEAAVDNVALQKRILSLEQRHRASAERVRRADEALDERDALVSKLTRSEARVAELQARLNIAESTASEAYHGTAGREQEIAVLRQDRALFEQQTASLREDNQRLQSALESARAQADGLRAERDAQRDATVHTHQRATSGHDERLTAEIARLRAASDREMDALRVQMHEVHERELRVLREARDMVALDRDRTCAREESLRAEHALLQQHYQELQGRFASETSDLSAEGKMKAFDLERQRVVHEETVALLGRVQSERDVLARKVDALKSEYYALQQTSAQRIGQLETECVSGQSKLEGYERLEKELDGVVMDIAARSSSGNSNLDEGQALLAAYSFGSGLPTSARRRMQQSLHLARRVVHLQSECGRLKNDLATVSGKVQTLTGELREANALLDGTRMQPHGYLLSRLRDAESRTRDAQAQLRAAQSLTDDLTRERNALLSTRNAMSADLERLLTHQSDIASLKRLVRSLLSHRPTEEEQANETEPKGKLKEGQWIEIRN